MLKFVSDLTADMKEDTIRVTNLLGRKITVRKLVSDMYSGKVEYNDALIHQFDRITIPQIAGQLQSLLEIYDLDSDKAKEKPEYTNSLIDKLKPFAEQAESGLVSQLLNLLAPESTKPKDIEADEQRKEIESLINEAKEIEEEAKRSRASADPRQEIQELKEKTAALLVRVESILDQKAPSDGDSDTLKDTLHTMQRAHDRLADRAQQELNILEDKIKDLEQRLQSTGTGGKTITIRID
jgi:hypothetical protein